MYLNEDQLNFNSMIYLIDPYIYNSYWIIQNNNYTNKGIDKLLFSYNEFKITNLNKIKTKQKYIFLNIFTHTILFLLLFTTFILLIIFLI